MEFEYKQGIVKWEKLRLYYNLVIGVVGFGLSYQLISSLGVAIYLVLAVMFCIAMNICFCLGPLFDVYARVFKFANPDKLRMPLFVMGLIASLLFTITTAGQAAFFYKDGLPSYGVEFMYWCWWRTLSVLAHWFWLVALARVILKVRMWF